MTNSGLIASTDRRHRLGGLVSLSLLVAITLVGCGDKKRTNDQANEPQQTFDIAFRALENSLRREFDAVACRQQLQDLNGYLDMAKMPSLRATADLAALQAKLTLTDAERDFLARKEFTALDGSYLAEALQLGEILKSLDLSKDPPVVQVTRTFAWAMRNVYLHETKLLVPPTRPNEKPTEQAMLPVPVEFILKRGNGSALERAYVAVALLNQLGFSVGFVGPGSAETARSAAQKPEGSQYPPFWAVGVQVGKDILLFDPWSGEPLRGPSGDAIATLAQARTDAGLRNFWKAQQISRPSEMKWPFADFETAIVTSVVFVGLPTPCLSVRMKFLHDQLQSAFPGIRLAAEPNEVEQAFRSHSGETIRYWSPKDDPGCYGRVLAYFSGKQEGGLAEETNRVSLYRVSTLPTQSYPFRQGFDLGGRLRELFFSEFEIFYFSKEARRDLIQRGDFLRAVGLLDRDLEEAERVLRLAGNEANLEARAEEWVEAAGQALAELRLAETGRSTLSPEAAKARVDAVWKESSLAKLYLDRAVRNELIGEAAFLKALCKHEEAERRQAAWARGKSAGISDSAAVRHAWQNALILWQNYHGSFQKTSPEYAGRTDHAFKLMKEAQSAIAALAQ